MEESTQGTTPAMKCGRDKKYLPYMLMSCSILIHIVLLIIVSATTKTPDQRPAPPRSELCLTCEDLFLFAPDDEQMLQFYQARIQDSVEYCCTSNATDLIKRKAERMARLAFANDTYRYLQPKETTTHCINSETWPSGYRLGQLVKPIKPPATESNGELKALKWDATQAGTLIGNGVQFLDSKRLAVSRNGTYYVYAFLTVEIDLRPHQTNSYPSLVVYVYKSSRSGSEEQQLMKREEQYRNIAGNITDKVTTLNIGSTFNISSEEAVYVKVSEPDRLVDGTNRNIFGLFITV